MPGFGLPELLVIGGVVVLLFGTKRLPDFARSLGKAKHEFRKGMDEEDQKVETVNKDSAIAR